MVILFTPDLLSLKGISWIHTIQAQVFIFIISAIAIWRYCRQLSGLVEYIDLEFNLGTAVGTTLILSTITNLPEIAITISGSLKGNYALVSGNILGGVAIQNLLLVLYDFKSKETTPLSTLTSSNAGKIQGITLVLILLLCYLGGMSMPSITFLNAGLLSWAIAAIWIGSFLFLKKFQKKGPLVKKENIKKYTRKSALIKLSVISLVVLFFGIMLENSSDAIAGKFNLSGIFFGATVLALVTSLPEISSGLAFIKNRDYPPLVSDIFGGNSFLPVLLLPASIIAGNHIIVQGDSNNIIILLALVLTAIFMGGMFIKLKTKAGCLGWDTWLMVTVGIIGFTILYNVSH